MRKINLLTSVALLAILPAVYANSNAGSKFYISTTAQAADLEDAAAYAALTYTEIKQVGNMGETGSSTNILTYDTWDTDVIQKAKGITDAGSPELEVARLAADPGQVALRAAALTNLNYAFKEERNDPATGGGTPTIIYNRGLVTGPSRPKGRNEDFDLEIFNLAFQQREIVVAPT